MGRESRRSSMKRIVKFEGEKAAKRFELARTALLNAGDGKGERNRERVRKEARLMEAFDRISEPVDPANPDGERKLACGISGDTLILSQEDHKLVEEYLSTTPWLPRSARAAVDAQDWWESAEKEEK
jgi:hypothetical protein